MNSKRISIIFILVAFVVVVIASCFGVLSVKDINVTFAVSKTTNTKTIQNLINTNIGKNWLTLSEEDIFKVLEGNHHLQIVSIDKQFPNVVNVKIKERREVYYTEYAGNTYVTDENGFVIKQGVPVGEAREKIQLKLGEGITLSSVQPGSCIKTDNDKLLAQVFDIAKSVNLTDCIESIVVERAIGYEGSDVYDVVFNAYTGVQLRVHKILENGNQKATNAFKAYDEKLTDYQKNSGEILSILVEDTGMYRVNYNGYHIMTVGP